MEKLKTRKFRIIIIIVILLIAILAGWVYYRTENRYVYADKKEIQQLSDTLNEGIENLKTTEDLAQYINNWADENKLNYTTDDAGNIIFKHKVKGSQQPTTILCVNYNALTRSNDVPALALAQYFAVHGLEDGSMNVIFMNNKKNLQEGAQGLSKKYIPKNANIIYLDAAAEGKSGYLSGQSYAASTEIVTVPTEMVDRRYDTGIEFTISGIESNVPSSTISKQANPITALGTVLTRLKTKSIDFQLASVEVEDKGNMYPTGIRATILVNSYSVDDVTKYLDNKSEDYIDDYSESFPDIAYGYEVIEDIEELPSKAFSDETVSILNTFLYTVKNGTYRFNADDAPEGYEENDIYGINCIESLYVENSNLQIRIHTSALTSDHLDQIVKENSDAASLSDAKLKTVDQISAFTNTDSEFAQHLTDTYSKANNVSGKEMILKTDADNGFTSCSILQNKNKSVDVVHLRMTDSNGTRIANTIMNYLTIDDNILGF